jgi:ketosteroid isomerase-like protein
MERADPRLAIIDRYLSAFEARDVPSLMALSSRATEWHLPGRSDLAGDRYGADDVRSFLEAFLPRLDPIDLRRQDTLTSELHVMVMHDAVVGPMRVNVAGSLLFDIRDGAVLKVFAVVLDLYAFDEVLAAGRPA